MTVVMGNALKQEAEYLWHEATRLEAEGLQQIEDVVVGSGAEVLYDIIQSSLADLICPHPWVHLYLKGRGRLP